LITYLLISGAIYSIHFRRGEFKSNIFESLFDIKELYSMWADIFTKNKDVYSWAVDPPHHTSPIISLLELWQP